MTGLRPSMGKATEIIYPGLTKGQSLRKTTPRIESNKQI